MVVKGDSWTWRRGWGTNGEPFASGFTVRAHRTGLPPIDIARNRSNSRLVWCRNFGLPVVPRPSHWWHIVALRLLIRRYYFRALSHSISLLEGAGFELLVPRHESPRFPKHPGTIAAPTVWTAATVRISESRPRSSRTNISAPRSPSSARSSCVASLSVAVDRAGAISTTRVSSRSVELFYEPGVLAPAR